MTRVFYVMGDNECPQYSLGTYKEDAFQGEFFVNFNHDDGAVHHELNVGSGGLGILPQFDDLIDFLSLCDREDRTLTPIGLEAWLVSHGIQWKSETLIQEWTQKLMTARSESSYPDDPNFWLPDDVRAWANSMSDNELAQYLRRVGEHIQAISGVYQRFCKGEDVEDTEEWERYEVLQGLDTALLYEAGDRDDDPDRGPFIWPSNF